jgi:small subunit ribosomal protein S1
VKRRISLGLKQTMDNPWVAFAAKYPAGTHVKGEVKNITEFGLFVGLDGDVEVEAEVIDVDREKERISLGIKQLANSAAAASGDLRKGGAGTTEVVSVQESGIEVKVVDTELTAFIRRGDLARDRAEQRPERFAVGEKVDARVIQYDKNSGKLSLSIKALEIAEEKAAVAQYGSTDSGASLGDILGAALNKAKKNAEGEDGEE